MTDGATVQITDWANMEGRAETICIKCGLPFKKTNPTQRYCSRECVRSNRRYIDQMGYVVVKLPDHPHATTNGWVREHIVVACATIGRPLHPGEEVHHKDENKQNNAPDNLIVTIKPIHGRIHHGNPRYRQYGEENTPVFCACGCGNTTPKYDSRGRPRKYIHGHNRN